VATAGESAPELHFPQLQIQHLMYVLHSSPLTKSKNLSNIQNQMFSCKLLQEFKNNQEKLILYPIF